jgi:hypothetical protein
MTDTPTDAMDRLDVVDVIHRYALGMDTKQWDMLDDVFVEDAVAEYGLDLGSSHSRAEIKDLVRNAISGLDATQHSMSNIIVAVDGDSATANCYLHAAHFLVNHRTGSNTWIVGGTYRYDLVRTPAGWRISHLVFNATWTDGNVGIMAASREGGAET